MSSDLSADAETLMPSAEADAYLQYHYIAANPLSEADKDLLDDAGDESEYSAAHRLFHPVLRDLVEEFGFRDLFLISGSGDVVNVTVRPSTSASVTLTGLAGEAPPLVTICRGRRSNSWVAMKRKTT